MNKKEAIIKYNVYFYSDGTHIYYEMKHFGYRHSTYLMYTYFSYIFLLTSESTVTTLIIT
jgi:hypothetical protein